MTETCEDFRSIDIAWLRRNEAKSSGYSGRITWSRGGNATGSIGFRVEHAGIRLTYRARAAGEDWQEIYDLIPVVTTDTNFGGRRHWFQCPSCGKRCRIIYGGSLCRCRRCYGLKYESQYEQDFSRATTMRHRLRAKLGHSGSLDQAFPPKPTGMHWNTYDRLKRRDEELENRWVAGCWNWLQRHEST